MSDESNQARKNTVRVAPTLASLRETLAAIKADCTEPGNMAARCAWTLAAQAVMLLEAVQGQARADGFRRTVISKPGAALEVTEIDPPDHIRKALGWPPRETGPEGPRRRGKRG